MAKPGTGSPVPPNSFVTVKNTKRIAIEPFMAEEKSGQVVETA